MRPSRSHESLSSPLKGSIRISQVTTRNNSIYQQHLSEVNSHSSSSKTKYVRANQGSISIKPYRLSQPTMLDSRNKIDENPSTQSDSSTSSAQAQIIDSILRISFGSESDMLAMLPGISAIHNSLLNEENCFELKCHSSTITVVNACTNEHTEEASARATEDNDSTSEQTLRYYASSPQFGALHFMCRSNEEKEKWIQCLRGVIEPNFFNNRRDENSLQLWILEAKGQAISSKPNKKYFCQILLNNAVYARTCCKLKKEILFWGENFDFK